MAPKVRPLLWGSMVVGAGKRRIYLFRLEPAGLLAIRVGFPISWFGFAGCVVGFYVLLNSTVLGWSSLIAGAAAGFVVLGLLDRFLARAVATQTRERVLQSSMNLYFDFETLGEVQFQESPSRTYLRFKWREFDVRVEINRPAPPAARNALGSLLPLIS
jgi:hypothetical protein